MSEDTSAPAMIVTPTGSDGLRRSFHVRIVAADMSARLEKSITDARGGMRLKGFRPGKVPASHIRKIYGRSMMEEEVRTAIGEAVRKVLEDENLRPAMSPDIHVTSDAAGVTTGTSDLEFDLKMDTLPQMTLAPLSELRLVKYTTEVPEEEVTRTVLSLAESAAVMHPASDDHAAGEGDACMVSYQGRIGGEPFSGGEATDELMVIGGKRYLPELEEALKGKRAGDSGSVEIVFPDDYGSSDLAGSTAEFSFQVKQVRIRKVPAVDDALAVSLGMKKLADLRQAVRTRVQSDYAGMSRRALERAALDWLDAEHRSIDLPSSLVEHEYGNIWSRGPEGTEDRASAEDKATCRTEAERRVRLGLVLAEIGSSAGIEVKQAELDRAVNSELVRHGRRRAEAAEYLRKHPEAVDRMRAPIYEGKVINYVIERAGVTPMALSFADFNARMRGKDAEGSSPDPDA